MKSRDHIVTVEELKELLSEYPSDYEVHYADAPGADMVTLSVYSDPQTKIVWIDVERMEA